MLANLGLVAGLFMGLPSCGGPSAPPFDVAAYEQEVLEWRAARLERLMAPMGYLTQTGLFWLEEGRYIFGSDDANDIVFAGPGAAFIGEFVVGKTGISMRVAPDIDVRVDGQPVSEIPLADDTTDAPVVVTHRSLAWSVVRRDDRFAVRLRDFRHPFLDTFGPLPYFDIDPALNVEARLRPYEEPRVVDVRTVIEGLGYYPTSPGLLVFEIDGQQYDLEAYQSGDQLFFVFGDATNRDDTYGAGRFLYAPMPGEDGVTRLDFNKAYSPPCAFNDFSTCPVASPRNRLPIRIEAGERYDKALHYSSDAPG
jgi:uncharacterized protein (DUF1684 family)